MSVARTLTAPVTVYNPAPLLNDHSNRDTSTGYAYLVPNTVPAHFSVWTARISFDVLTCIDRVEFTFTSSVPLTSDFWSRLDLALRISGPGTAFFNAGGPISPTNLNASFIIAGDSASAVLVATLDPTFVTAASMVLSIAAQIGTVTATVTDFRAYRLGYEVLVSGGNCSTPGGGNDPNGNPAGTVPPAPVLSGAPICCGTQNVLSWTAAATATGYRLYNGSTLLYNGPLLTFTYALSAAERDFDGSSLGIPLTYTVIAYNGSGDSAAGVFTIRAPWESSEDCSAMWTSAEDCTSSWSIDGCE